jgi:membrane fusion protein, multidrug efflux system
MRPYAVAALAPTLLASAILAACTTGEAEQSRTAPPPPTVTAAEVIVRDLKEWADFTGRLEAASLVEVRPRVGGYVESVHFVEGSRVSKGDLLFQIDARPFKAEVARLTAELERAQAELAVARSYRDRAERLVAENATSREELEGLAANAAVAAAALDSIQAALEAAQLDLSFSRVMSPIDGRVSHAIVHAGNLVDSSILLTTVVADDPIHAYFDVDEHTYLELIHGRDRKRVSAGVHDRAVFVGLANEEGYPHRARLDFVDNQVDPNQGTIRARAVLDNADGRFTPGLFARLRVIGEHTYRGALIDERAIGTDLDRKYVLIVDENDVAQYRAVQLGRSVDGLRVVAAGLHAGERVIINGLQRVRPGMPVAATEAPQQDGSPQIERFATADEMGRTMAASTSR